MNILNFQPEYIVFLDGQKQKFILSESFMFLCPFIKGEIIEVFEAFAFLALAICSLLGYIVSRIMN
jgi:hypothetical protein